FFKRRFIGVFDFWMVESGMCDRPHIVAENDVIGLQLIKDHLPRIAEHKGVWVAHEWQKRECAGLQPKIQFENSKAAQILAKLRAGGCCSGRRQYHTFSMRPAHSSITS